MVLDYLMAKVAGLEQRFAPFGDVPSPVGQSDNYGDADFLGRPATGQGMDPAESPSRCGFAGTTDMMDQIALTRRLSGSRNRCRDYFGWEMQWAGLSDYRACPIPSSI